MRVCVCVCVGVCVRVCVLLDLVVSRSSLSPHSVSHIDFKINVLLDIKTRTPQLHLDNTYTVTQQLLQLNTTTITP